MTSKRRVWPKNLKSGVNKTIGHVNKNIGHFNELMQSVDLESNNEKTTCSDKDEQIVSVYDNKGK